MSTTSGMGVFGPMVIQGPTTANFDEELEPIMLNDWTHQTVDELWYSAQTGGPPQLDNALINGKGTFDGAGERYEMSFEAGQKYKLRFINSAIDSYFKLSLDGHNMTVVAMDFVPVEPFEVEVLDITMGMPVLSHFSLRQKLTSQRPALRRYHLSLPRT